MSGVKIQHLSCSNNARQTIDTNTSITSKVPITRQKRNVRHRLWRFACKERGIASGNKRSDNNRPTITLSDAHHIHSESTTKTHHHKSSPQPYAPIQNNPDAHAQKWLRILKYFRKFALLQWSITNCHFYL